MARRETAEVSLDAGSQPTQSLSTDNLQKPAGSSNNQISSEYQRSYQWKLPIVQVNKPPRAPSKSEYQREYCWKSAPSTPVKELLSDSKSSPQSSSPSTPKPVPQSVPQSSVIDNKSVDTTRLTDVSIKTLTTDDFNAVRRTPEPTKDINAVRRTPELTKDITNVLPVETNVKQNGTYTTEPDTLASNSGKFTSSAGIDKWKDGLRNSSNESNYDPIEKKIVVLEGSRLSKRSRCRSMYSLRDELKTKELANQLSDPYETEYKQQFVDWVEYYNHERKPLQRRGSWSAPLDNFKSLDGFDRNDSKSSEPRKHQPLINDSTSIKSNHSRGLMRPSTSAEFRNYRSDYNDVPSDKFSKLNLNDYYSSSQAKGTEIQKSKSSELQKFKSNEMQRTKSSGSSPLRNSVFSQNDLISQQDTPDYRRRNISAIELPGRPRNRDTHMDERRRDYEHLYDRCRDPMNTNRKDDYDKQQNDKSYNDRYNNNHLSNVDYNYYITERQLDNGYDIRYNKRDHDEYYKHGNRSAHISDKEHYGRHANGHSDGHSNGHSNGHSRNTSYSSTSDLDPSRSYVRSPLPNANPSYLDHLRHRPTASDSSSVSTPSSPATPNGFYDNDYRSRKSNGLDPRIYKEQTYSSAITSKSHMGPPKLNLPLDDDKERYYRSNPLSPSRNKFYLEDDKERYRQSPSRNKFYLEDRDDDDDISHYVSSKRSPQVPLPSILRDKSLAAKSPTPSTPRSYQSTYSSPPFTRAPSPTRNSYAKKHNNYYYETSSPTLSPTYSSRPPSRATSVSSHATSIEEESVILTDILRDADSLTLKNLTDQLKIFKHREIKPPTTKKNTSHSTPGTRRSSVTTTQNSSTKSTKGTKSSSVPGTPSSAQKKKSSKTTKSIPSKSSVTSSYREAYRDYTLDKRPEPTDFTAAREALSRAKLKVEEMLELVSNNGSLY
ncbi:32254_t:CDS:2 [Racocetra persica]|uniref:32254_t:CDS:1 n=1 Tax=Racocetra persica TaxID=160502 RepID=A0ACA9KJT6_9GLOM|nr:32254_t:CDS:2 [Racocetra persica]